MQQLSFVEWIVVDLPVVWFVAALLAHLWFLLHSKVPSLHRWCRSTLFNPVFMWKLSRNCGARFSPQGCFSEALNPAASVHGDCGNQSLPTANRYIQDCSGDVPSWIVVSAHSAVRLGVETRMGPVNIFWFSFQVHRHIEKHLYCGRRLKDG